MIFIGTHKRKLGEFIEYLIINFSNACHIYDFNRQSLFRKLFSNLDGPGHHTTIGDNGAIFPCSDDIHLSVLKVIIFGEQRRFVLPVYYRPSVSPGTDEKIAFFHCSITDRTVGLIGITWNNNLEMVKVVRESYIIRTLVGLTIRSDI